MIINTLNIQNGATLNLKKNTKKNPDNKVIKMLSDTLNNNGTINISEGSELELNTLNNSNKVNLSSGIIKGSISNSSSEVIDIGDSSIVYGTIIGGTVNIKTNYNNSSTTFGTSSGAINILNIESSKGLTLSNDAFINTMNNNGSLTINNGTTQINTVLNNLGIVNVNSGTLKGDTYNNKSGTTTLKNSNTIFDKYNNKSRTTTNIENGTLFDVNNYNNKGTTNVKGGELIINNELNVNAGSVDVSGGKITNKFNFKVLVVFLLIIF